MSVETSNEMRDLAWASQSESNALELRGRLLGRDVQWRALGTAFCSALLLAVGLTIGCGPTEPNDSSPPVVASGEPLQLLIVGSPEAAAAIERFWNAEAATPMRARSISPTEFSADPAASLADTDVVVYPSQMLPDLAEERLLLKLDSSQFEGDNWNAADVLPLEKGIATQWGDEPFAISLGHRPWVMAYRSDMLAAIGETAPTTWEDYERIANLLASPPAGTAATIDDRWRTTWEPIAPDWGAHWLLARAGSSIRHRGAYSGLFDLGQTSPLLTTPAYRSALESLQRLSPPDDSTPESCLLALVRGEGALAILPLPTAANLAAMQESSEAIEGESGSTDGVGQAAEGDANVAQPVAAASWGLLRFGPLPGSPRVYVSGQGEWRDRTAGESLQVPYLGRPGTLASIVSTTKRAGTSSGLLKWLGARDMQGKFAELLPDTFPTRFSSLASLTQWLDEGLSAEGADDLDDLIRSENEAFVVMFPPRYPQAELDLAVLQQAVEQAIAGTDAQQALDRASKAWGERIEKVGRQEFLRLNEAGLGL